MMAGVAVNEKAKGSFSQAEVGAVRQRCPRGGSFAEDRRDSLLHWIEIELVDEEGQPVPGEEYCIIDPDGIERRGFLDERGRAKEVGMEKAGECKVTFARLDKDAWERA